MTQRSCVEVIHGRSDHRSGHVRLNPRRIIVIVQRMWCNFRRNVHFSDRLPGSASQLAFVTIGGWFFVQYFGYVEILTILFGHFDRVWLRLWRRCLRLLNRRHGTLHMLLGLLRFGLRWPGFMFGWLRLLFVDVCFTFSVELAENVLNGSANRRNDPAFELKKFGLVQVEHFVVGLLAGVEFFDDRVETMLVWFVSRVEAGAFGPISDLLLLVVGIGLFGEDGAAFSVVKLTVKTRLDCFGSVVREEVFHFVE